MLGPVQEQDRRMTALGRPRSKAGRGRPAFEITTKFLGESEGRDCFQRPVRLRRIPIWRRAGLFGDRQETIFW